MEQIKATNENVGAADWLVVAHDDIKLLRKLGEIVPGDESITMKVAQSDWQCEEDSLPEAILWALQEGGMKTLLMIGHSAGCPGANQGSKSAQSSVSPDACYTKLMTGAKRVQERTSASKKHFAEQLEQLCQVKPIHDAIVAGDLKLHGLFYVAQSGTFLKYDMANGQFC